MSVLAFMPAVLREWGWLFGFALISLALVALAVVADALYEGYRARSRHGAQAHSECLPEGSEKGKRTAA